MEEDKEKNSGFSFMQEKIKEKPVYANPLVKKALRCILGGALFGGTALLIWALALPRINNRMEKNEIQEIQIPEETVIQRQTIRMKMNPRSILQRLSAWN